MPDNGQQCAVIGSELGRRRRHTQTTTPLTMDSTEPHRAVRKQRTRQALLDAALGCLETRSFSGLSLREVTREAGIVPAAFYRHFQNMDELGLALVAESFTPLRQMLRSARGEHLPAPEAIGRFIEVLIDHVHHHRGHCRFITGERSGVGLVRQAIRWEIRLFSSELATDLAHVPAFTAWSTHDLQVIAGLIVNAMISTAESILDAPAGRPEVERQIRHAAEQQLRMIMFGVPRWISAPAGSPAR